MFIQTEATPDPGVLKFFPGETVLGKGSKEFESPEEAASSPLAVRLFGVPGVSAVFFGPEFILVRKSEGDWAQLKPMVLGAIMEHYLSGDPVIRPPASSAQNADESASEQVIREALKQVIDPELGYNIVDIGLIYRVESDADGRTIVTMTTTTRGCPATNYLTNGAGEAARSVSGVTEVDVRLTYEPAWVPEMMSPAAKQHFGIKDGAGW